MKPNASYSALGRIRKLFIFDTTEYVLKDEPFPFWKIKERYQDLALSLNRFNTDEKTEIYIFFRINPYSFKAFPNHDRELNLYFVPVNVLLPSASIPTDWLQDIIHVSGNGKLLVAQKMIGPDMIEILRRYTHADEVRRIPRPCPGGNILRGNLNGADYMLHGYTPESDCNPYELSKHFGIDMENMILAYDGDMDEFDELFYHADLYTTIVGPVEDENGDSRELILLAKCDELSDSRVRKGLDDLQVRMQELRQARPLSDGKSALIFDLLPFVTLSQQEDGTICHALSYNNCLVENFTDKKGMPRIRMYFPDYRREMQTLIDRQSENEEAMRQLAKKIYAASKVNKLSNDVKPGKPLTYKHTVAFLDGVHEVIRETLAKYGITEVEFVKHDFRSMAQRLGSLRCMTKVVERDCLPG